MIRKLRVLPGLLALAATAAFGANPPAPARPAVARLGWLAGSWRCEKAGRVTDEQWLAPAAGMMLGVARTVAKGKVLEYEFLQIREGPGGDVFFVALPAGQKETAFRLSTQTERTVVFENQEHDFPQTIAYALQADDTLLAVIEGPGPGGAPKKLEWVYQRRAGPAP